MGTKRILVVEDEIIVAESVQLTLKSFGYDVTSLVTSGSQVLKKVKEDSPDLVLMDIVLDQEWDGIKLAGRIKSRFNIPVIFLTAYSDRELIERAKVIEPYGYIIKPFEDRELNSVIEIALYKNAIETKLKDSEAQYKELVEKAGIGILIDDREGCILYANKKAAEIYGYSVKALRKLKLKSLVHPADRDKVEQYHRDRISGKTVPSTYEFIGIRKDGSERNIELHAAIKMEKKKIVGTRIYIKDITERVQSEKKRQIEEERFRVMFQSSNDLLSIADSSNKILLSNPAWEKALGFTLETQGNPIDRIHPKDRNRVLEEWEKLLRGEVDSIRIEYRYKTKSRKYLDLDTTILPLELGGESLFFINAHDVTERKKIQAVLKASEERFREIVELMSLGMATTNIKGFVTHCNREFLQLTGYSKEEIVGKHITKLPTFQGMDIKSIVNLFHSLLKGGLTTPFEFDWVRKDGVKRLGEARASIVRRAGRISELQAVLIDITDRKKKEENLRFSNATFQSIQESVIATDLDYTITYWNEASERIYGIKASEALGNKLTEIVEITATYSGEEKKRINTLEAEGCFQDEQLHKTKNNVVWVNVSYQEIVGDGQRTGWVVLTTDISKRKITEKKLRENEEFLINILESMSDGVLALNRDFQYTYWNKGMEIISKTSREELLYSEKLPWEIFPFLAKTGVDEMMKTAMRGEIVQSDEIPFMLEDGTQGITSEIFFPLRGVGGQIRGVLGVVKNISDRKKVEHALKESEDNLRNLTQHLETVRENERTNMAREIHDELGQSLTALKMDVFWLQKKFGHIDNEIKRKTDSMIGLTDQTIQRVKKICADLRPGLLDDLGLIPAIEWQTEEFQNRFGIACDLEMESEDLPIDSQCSTPLFRIFQETLTNVARHSQATKLKISLLEKNGQIEMIVKDNGIGISDEKLNHSKSFGLMGIKERVLGLAGEILIQGVKDKGTTVTVNIPIVKPVP